MSHRVPEMSALRTRIAGRAAAMMAHPERHRATAIYAEAIMELYPGPSVVRFLINETARSELVNLCIVLDVLDPDPPSAAGLTMGRMQQVASDLGIASPGRTFAFLKMLEVAGYLEKTETADRRLRCLKPSAKLIDHQTRLLAGLMQAADIVTPGAGCEARFNAPDGRLALVREGGRDFLGGFRVSQGLPLSDLFAGRDGGFQFLLWMLKEGGVLDRADPGEPAISFALSEIGPRFGLSRPHLRSVLRGAESVGLLETRLDRTYMVVLKRALQTAFAEHVMGLLAYFADLMLERLPSADAA